ncbi:MAG: hypothetical protein EOP21_07425 [Hyphomicrobiales bacterium]|nr:MAG: hypothetical protein EOP21_07425 [Hyphomicrobiales bacterium]
MAPSSGRQDGDWGLAQDVASHASQRPLLFSNFALEPSFNPSFLSGEATTYGAWLDDLRPRTCLLVYWLSSLGALPAPPRQVQERAQKFAWKKTLLSRLIENPQSLSMTEDLLESDDFDVFVAHLMWMRFVEYVPARFVSNQSRTQVLSWVRSQLQRAELSDEETVRELNWRVEHIYSRWTSSEGGLPF